MSPCDSFLISSILDNAICQPSQGSQAWIWTSHVENSKARPTLVRTPVLAPVSRSQNLRRLSRARRAQCRAVGGACHRMPRLRGQHSAGPALKHLRERPAAGPSFYASEILDDGLCATLLPRLHKDSGLCKPRLQLSVLMDRPQMTRRKITGTAQLMFRITTESGSRKAQCNKAEPLISTPFQAIW